MAPEQKSLEFFKGQLGSIVRAFEVASKSRDPNDAKRAEQLFSDGLVEIGGQVLYDLHRCANALEVLAGTRKPGIFNR